MTHLHRSFGVQPQPNESPSGSSEIYVGSDVKLVRSSAVISSVTVNMTLSQWDSEQEEFWE